MRLFRWVMALAILACLLPAIGAFAAIGIANLNGCTLHEGFANPCVVLGRDIGKTLYTMGVLAWFMLATLPIAAALGAAWAVVEGVRGVRTRMRSRQA